MSKKATAKTSKARGEVAGDEGKSAKKATRATATRDDLPAKKGRGGGEASGGTIELRYTLAELPSSQHRAGLAGLVLMVRWLEGQPKSQRKGTCAIESLDAKGLTLRLDEAGLASLFDLVYKASAEEQAYPAPFKNKDPLRTEVQESVVTDKAGKEKVKSKTVYIYPVTVPDGAFLTDWDKTHSKSKPGLWVKLWRDMVWGILRGVPATRRPFELRADGEPTSDAADTWADLRRGDKSVDLPSTYYLGAQSSTAELVAFKDRARYQFLLHFWPFIAQIYVPQVLNNEGKLEHAGYAIAVPDVADLADFCLEIADALKDRSVDDNALAGYRPRGCLIDLSVEGGLDLFRRLRAQIQRREGQRRTGDLVLGIDVFHMEKEGNNIRVRGVARVDPDENVIDAYGRVRGTLWSPVFRRQRIANLIAQRPWHHGFDRIFATTPWKQTIDNDYFKHDARLLFKEFADMTEASDNENHPLETILYRLVGAYISRKIENKYGIKYGKQMSEEEVAKYRDYREKIARDAFLAIRSRTGVDFVDFFTGTLCSVPQHMREPDFNFLSRALLDDAKRDEVRTLTLLALSARG